MFRQARTLASESLLQRAMHSSQILPAAQPQVINGTYGTVRLAYLPGYSPPLAVAVKMLRPPGDWQERVRVVAVRRKWQ